MTVALSILVVTFIVETMIVARLSARAPKWTRFDDGIIRFMSYVNAKADGYA